MRRRVLIAFGVALSATTLGACSPPPDATTPGPANVGQGSVPARPEQAWLTAIGTGAAQTTRVCQRGAKDRVATVLCGPNASGIRGLSELYRALGFGEPASRYVASTTHSLALSARIVSAANPRSFVFTPERAPVPFDHVVATAFARGEQFVELVGLDPATLDYNFYLLSFEQACNESRCTPADLLTEKIESGWTSFTLYQDRDLEDTPLDCNSCHQPFGPGTRKQLVMRQTAHPWLHWGDFRGITENRICPDPPGPPPGRLFPGDGLDLLVKLEGRGGRHAGVPIAELADSASGERFSLFLTDAENTTRGSLPSSYGYAQLDFDSTMPLCERLWTGQSPTWERARQESMAKGLPVPYFAHDVMDTEKRAEIAADRGKFLARHAGEDAFDVAMSLIAADVSTAVGFVPRESDSAETILREMCVRCHAASTETRLRRARFNAERLKRIEPGLAEAIRGRLTLPRSSPELMPPVRTGELPPWAIARIDAYLKEHCSVPGGCD